MAPSAGSRGGPPISPVASSRPSGIRWTRMASITSSSPGNRVGLSNLGCTQTRREEERRKINDTAVQRGRTEEDSNCGTNVKCCAHFQDFSFQTYSLTSFHFYEKKSSEDGGDTNCLHAIDSSYSYCICKRDEGSLYVDTVCLCM